MKFRRLYWVTEQTANDGSSQVTGVFTSINDLVNCGIQWAEGCSKTHGFRLTLVKLDSEKPPLGCWKSPDFSGIEEDLHEYVATDEMNAQDVEQLAVELRSFYSR